MTKHHTQRAKRSTLCQRVTTRQSYNKDINNINNKTNPKQKHHLGTVSKDAEWLKMFSGTNCNLKFNVDYDT